MTDGYTRLLTVFFGPVPVLISMQNPDWLAQCVEFIVKPKPTFTPELIFAGLALLISAASAGLSVFLYFHKQSKDTVDETRRLRLSVFTILFLSPQVSTLKEFFGGLSKDLSTLPNGLVTLAARQQMNEKFVTGQEKLNGEFDDLLPAFDRELHNRVKRAIEALVDNSTEILLDTTPVPSGETIKSTLRELLRKTNAQVLGEFYQFDPVK